MRVSRDERRPECIPDRRWKSCADRVSETGNGGASRSPCSGGGRVAMKGDAAREGTAS
jgi:hypothetical protein